MSVAEEHARDLLGRLPPELPTPEWVDSASDMIGLDWTLARMRQVSVDVHDTHLDLTAILNDTHVDERIAYTGGPIPARLLDVLQQLMASA